MAQGVKDEITGEDPLPFAVHGGIANALVEMVDRRSQVRLSVPVAEYKPARSGIPPSAEQDGRPIRERDYPPGILALAFPNTDEAKPSPVYRLDGHIRPFQPRGLSDAQPGFEHQGGNIVQRLSAGAQVDVFLLAGKHKFSSPLTREKANPGDALNLFPLLGKTEHPAESSKLPVDRCRAYGGLSFHDVGFDEAIV
jgi:hypothetical protein